MSWRPRSFVERIGAALVAPRAALAAADEEDAAGRTGTDAALLLLFAVVALHTTQVVVSGWLAVVDSVSSGLGALVGLIGNSVGMDLAVILVAGAIVTVAAGRRRSVGRDFDLACVAYVPFVVIKLLAYFVVAVAGLAMTDAVNHAAMVAALGWAGVVVVLAIAHARRRGEVAVRRAQGARVVDRASRWAGRAAVGLGLAVLAVNAVGIARHWDDLRPVAPGDIAPPFSLPRLDGTGRLGLEELRGRVVLVDFWATWCDPCVDAMPALERIYNRFQSEGFEIVSVNTEGPEAAGKARRLARELGLSFPIVVDDGYAASLYKVSTIPHLVLIDRRGVVAEVHRGSGVGLEGHLVKEIEALLR